MEGRSRTGVLGHDPGIPRIPGMSSKSSKNDRNYKLFGDLGLTNVIFLTDFDEKSTKIES